MKIKMVIGCLFFWGMITAQVGIGTVTPNPSAVLDITSTDKGVLVPQISLSDVTNSSAPIASPAVGLLIWNTNASVTGGNGIGFYFFNGAQWIMISSASSPKGTLDDSYDDGGPGIGRTINATDGAVSIDGLDGFQITGTYGSGATIPNGNNARFYFNPRKAAFRSGYVSGAQWNNANVGNYSVGVGNGTIASGESSIAAGSSTEALGRYSAAFGRFTEAPSYAEFAIGSYPTTYTPNNANVLDMGDRAFVVGNASTTINRSNAFEIWKDGRVVINESYTLPTSDGSSGQVLETDGGGNVSWSTVTGGAEVPTGAIFAFPTGSAPTGYLVCDGSAISRTTYSNLFALIGVTYGNGNGSTTFNLPDYRGQFLRGNDNGAGIDPDASSRLDRGDGTTGDNVGTRQNDEFGSHLHTVNPPITTTSSNGNHFHSHGSLSGATSITGSHSHNTSITVVSTTSSGSHNHNVSYRRNDDVNFGLSGSDTDIDELFPSGAGTGTYTTDTTGSHTHMVTIPALSTDAQGNHNHTWSTGTFNSVSNGDHNHTVDIAAFNSSSNGGNETRPTNVSVLWCIKI